MAIFDPSSPTREGFVGFAVEDCQFDYNVEGALISSANSTSISNSVFLGNTATTSSAGVYIGESCNSVEVTNSIFDSNTGQVATLHGFASQPCTAF